MCLGYEFAQQKCSVKGFLSGHTSKGKRFNSSLMGMLFMCSILPVGRVIESGRLAGAEWQPWRPWDQCFDNKCLLLFGPKP